MANGAGKRGRPQSIGDSPQRVIPPQAPPPSSGGNRNTLILVAGGILVAVVIAGYGIHATVKAKRIAAEAEQKRKDTELAEAKQRAEDAEQAAEEAKKRAAEAEKKAVLEKQRQEAEAREATAKKKQEAYRNGAKKLLRALKKVQAATEVGITQQRFSEKAADVTFELKEFEAAHKMQEGHALSHFALVQAAGYYKFSADAQEFKNRRAGKVWWPRASGFIKAAETYLAMDAEKSLSVCPACDNKGFLCEHCIGLGYKAGSCTRCWSYEEKRNTGKDCLGGGCHGTGKCSSCKGTGKFVVKCGQCQGSGVCPKCNAKPKVCPSCQGNMKCKTCKGDGRVACPLCRKG